METDKIISTLKFLLDVGGSDDERVALYAAIAAVERLRKLGIYLDGRAWTDLVAVGDVIGALEGYEA